MLLDAVRGDADGDDNLGGYVHVTCEETGRVQRSDDRGGSWVAVRNGESVVPGRDLYDYEAPFNTELYYRVLSTGGTQVAEAGPVQLESTYPWITSALNPGVNERIRIVDVTARRHETRTTVIPVLGSSQPVVVSDVTQSLAADLVLLMSVTRRTRILQVFAPGAAVLLRSILPSIIETMYITATGEITDEPANQAQTMRIITVPFQRVERPEGTTTVVPGGLATWGELKASGMTWGELKATGATWAELASGDAGVGR